MQEERAETCEEALDGRLILETCAKGKKVTYVILCLVVLSFFFHPHTANLSAQNFRAVTEYKRFILVLQKKKEKKTFSFQT